MNRDPRPHTSRASMQEQGNGSRISYDARNMQQLTQEEVRTRAVDLHDRRARRYKSDESRSGRVQEHNRRGVAQESRKRWRETVSPEEYSRRQRRDAFREEVRNTRSYAAPRAYAGFEDYQNQKPGSRKSAFKARERGSWDVESSRTRAKAGNRQGSLEPQFDARPIIPHQTSVFERISGFFLGIAGTMVGNPLGKKLIIGAFVALVAFFGLGRILEALPIPVTVNGQEISLGGSKTLNELKTMPIAEGFAGNFVGVDGSLIQSGGGYPFTALVNGEMVRDYSTPIPANAQIELTQGGNIEEPAEETETYIPFTIQERGSGPVHVISSEGIEGIEVHKVGKVTGKEADQTRQEMQPRIYDRRTIDTQGKKIVAFTFDDGPWEEYTAEILDILKENNAHATFFTVGQRIKDEGIDLVKRAYDEGHQVATHTWDHAGGSGQGVNLSFMTKEEQREEIEKGQEAIKDALNVDPSKAFRAPGGNFPFKVWQNVEDLISAELGWNVDTFDWKRPGSASIAKAMLSVAPGDIVLCHDGGGDRSQTVEALREVLPKLKAEGWEFVTIDELLKYPLKETKDPLKPVIESKSKKAEAKG